jgi:hypothetical protein
MEHNFERHKNGKVKMNGEEHSQETYTYENGDVYEGEWKDGIFDGYGLL